MPELTVMMVPAPRPIRCGVNASMTRMVPRRLVSIVSCAALKCAGSRRSSGIPTPDIVTIVSRPGWLRRIVSRARPVLAASVTSMGTVANPSAASLSSRSARRPPTMTSLPAAAKRRASSRPIPEVAPAMKTVRLVMSIACSCSGRQTATSWWARSMMVRVTGRGLHVRLRTVIRRHLQRWLVLRPQAVPPSSGVPSGPP